MHPNWRALSTVHIPYKVFVSGSAERTEPADFVVDVPFHFENSRQTYEETLKELPEMRKQRVKRNDNIPKAKSVAKLNPFHEPTFFRACMSNDLATLHAMDLSSPVHINATDNFGWNGLMVACCEGSTQAFEFLLEQGIDHVTCRERLERLAETKNRNDIIQILEAFVHKQTMRNTKAPVEAVQSQPTSSSFHCRVCEMDFHSTDEAAHQTSVLHRFNRSNGQKPAPNLLRYSIPASNQGYQLMKKQGWNGASGLGPSETGYLYPIKTVIRKPRSGLGVKQPNPSRVTHFGADDLTAIKFQRADRAKTKQQIRRDYESDRRKDKRLRRTLS